MDVSKGDIIIDKYTGDSYKIEDIDEENVKLKDTNHGLIKNTTIQMLNRNWKKYPNV